MFCSYRDAVAHFDSVEIIGFDHVVSRYYAGRVDSVEMIGFDHVVSRYYAGRVDRVEMIGFDHMVSRYAGRVDHVDMLLTKESIDRFDRTHTVLASA